MNSLNSSNQPTLANKLTKISISQSERRSLQLIEPLAKLDRPTLEQKKAISYIYTEQASIYLKECSWHKATVACKNALDLFPDNVEAYKVLGDILYHQGKSADALGIYAKALAIDPDCATVYANVGTIYADRAKWQKARDYYQQAVILDPNLAGTYRNLARVWEELGDNDKALECFCRASDLEPTALKPEAYFDFGRKLYQQGKIKEASILFIHGTNLAPEAETELTQLVDMLEELEEWQQAVVYYHKLISLPETDGDDRPAIAEYYADFNAAGKPIRQLLSDGGITARSAFRGNLETTRTQYKPQTQYQLLAQKIGGKITGRCKHSSKNTQTKITLSPSNMARQLSSKSKPIAGIATKSSSSALTPKTKEKMQSSKTDAITVESQPNNAKSWNNLGSLYAQKKQWSQAADCYQKSLELDPDFAKSHRNLARVYNYLDEELKAALCWYKAFALEPDSAKPQEYFLLANKLLQHQQTDKAIACLNRAIELEPDFSQAHHVLSELAGSN